MRPPPRAQSTVTYVAVAVSLLALLVAATSTAFAAGLAKNSVGAKQIKSNAVRSAEIKPGAVTADRIAPGVVPPKTVHVARVLPISGAGIALLRLGGLSFDAACNSAAQDFVEVTITRTGGGALTASGIFSLETSLSDASYPYVDDGTVVDVLTMAPSNDGFGAFAFDGVVTAAGHTPVQVQVTVQVDDGTTNPCHTFVTATPIG
jgi:hypothetical protein